MSELLENLSQPERSTSVTVGMEILKVPRGPGMARSTLWAGGAGATEKLPRWWWEGLRDGLLPWTGVREGPDESAAIHIAEKTAQVAMYPARYPEWWLLFVDLIGYGLLSEETRRDFRASVFVDRHNWHRIILVNPLDHR